MGVRSSRREQSRGSSWKAKHKLTLAVQVLQCASELVRWGDWGQSAVMAFYRDPRSGEQVTVEQAVRVPRGEALSYYVINRVVTRWTRRHLGVRLTPHKLRHAYGKQCVDRGVDIRGLNYSGAETSIASGA